MHNARSGAVGLRVCAVVRASSAVGARSGTRCGSNRCRCEARPTSTCCGTTGFARTPARSAAVVHAWGPSAHGGGRLVIQAGGLDEGAVERCHDGDVVAARARPRCRGQRRGTLDDHARAHLRPDRDVDRQPGHRDRLVCRVRPRPRGQRSGPEPHRGVRRPGLSRRPVPVDHEPEILVAREPGSEAGSETAPPEPAAARVEEAVRPAPQEKH